MNYIFYLFSKVEEMVKEVYDWESELQRLVQVDGINGASKGVPEMVVEDGPLISFNAYDRRTDCWQVPSLLRGFGVL
jgi:hypothetical protein